MPCPPFTAVTGDGTCIAIFYDCSAGQDCPGGTHCDATGKCIPITCPAGTIRQVNGTCLPECNPPCADLGQGLVCVQGVCSPIGPPPGGGGPPPPGTGTGTNLMPVVIVGGLLALYGGIAYAISRSGKGY